MDLDQLKQLLTLVQEHGVAELEIEQEGVRIRVRKDAAPAAPAPVFHMSSAPASAPAVSTAAVGPVPIPATPPADEADTDIELAVVKSPIVGTFYRSPEPGASPFVEVGATVKRGQVLCIIEAMKLMNEIDSEYDGEVVNVYVETGQPVQYGERLFAIRTK
jgi:acetyl-CoA carboxylase biotin carboxyl carrier protein